MDTEEIDLPVIGGGVASLTAALVAVTFPANPYDGHILSAG